MSESAKDLVRALYSVKTLEELDQIINQIAHLGEPAVPELLAFAKENDPRLTMSHSLLRIFQKMGYPANRSALGLMVGQASNTNSRGLEIALDTLVEIGEPAIPEIRTALKFYSSDLDFYRPEVDGLITLLELMGSPVIDPLLPDLLQLLEAGEESALRALQKIGSPK